MSVEHEPTYLKLVSYFHGVILLQKFTAKNKNQLTKSLWTNMKPENNHGIKRVFRATGFSMQGLKSAWTHEAAFRQELVLAFLMLPIALFVDISTVERLLLILTLFIVLIVELLNSAVEAVVDRIGDEIHVLSGQAKDIASAAVFMSLALCAITWAVVLGTRYL
jgi:diacylglycerol kinase (ATP)